MKNQESFPTKSNMVLFFLEGSKRYFILSVITAMGVSFFDMVNPKIIGFTVDTVIGGETSSLPFFVNDFLDRFCGGTAFFREHIGAVAAAVILIAALSAVCRYCTGLLNSKGSEYLVQRMRNQLFGHILRLPFAWYNHNHTGDIIQRCTSDVDTVRRFVAEQLTQLVRVVILMTLALSFMSGINTRLMIAAFAFIPVIILYSLFFHNRIASAFEHADVEEGKLSAIAQENLTGVRVVRAFGREQYEKDRFEKKNHEYTLMWIHLMKLLAGFWASGDLISGLQVLTVTVLGAVYCVRGQLTAGDYIAFVTYNAMLTWPVRELGRVISEMSKAGISIERIRYIMNSPTEEMLEREGRMEAAAPVESRNGNAVERPAETYGDTAGRGLTGADAPMNEDIVFDHVSYHYQVLSPGQGDASRPRTEEGPEVLEDVSFRVKAGQTVGILGGTGSGKSTLMYLLDKLYELPEGCGSIRIGDSDIRAIDTEWLRSNIGMVLQEPYLFSRTLGENIAIAGTGGETQSTDASAVRAEIMEASRVASLDETVLKFAEGYETAVGERGVTLSGGQKQRAAIAQMLVRRPQIMVFDDSLSAVDAKTDAKIRRALQKTTSGTTVILIAHRITTLMQADRIIVLDRGRVAEQGTHEELLLGGGIYRRIYDLQAAGSDIQE